MVSTKVIHRLKIVHRNTFDLMFWKHVLAVKKLYNLNLNIQLINSRNHGFLFGTFFLFFIVFVLIDHFLATNTLSKDPLSVKVACLPFIVVQQFTLVHYLLKLFKCLNLIGLNIFCLTFLPKGNIRFQWKFGNNILANEHPLMTFDLQMNLAHYLCITFIEISIRKYQEYWYLNIIGVSNGFKCLFHFLISRLSSQIKIFINLQQ